MTKQQKIFIQLRAIEGLSLTSIMEKMSVSKATVEKWNRDLNFEVEEAIYERYEQIRERFGISTVRRFNDLASTYQRLRDELNKRDFSGLPTDKVYSMMKDISNKLDLIEDENVQTFDPDEDL